MASCVFNPNCTAVYEWGDLERLQAVGGFWWSFDIVINCYATFVVSLLQALPRRRTIIKC